MIKNNLFSYTIATMSGTASVTQSAGIYFDTWSLDDLNGNDAFIVSTHSTVDGYENISGFTNWDKYGPMSGLRHGEIKMSIENEWSHFLEGGGTWSDLNASDKEVLSKYFVVDKSLRDEVHTQQEQDNNDFYVLYCLLNKDAEERLGNYSMANTPKSIDYKKDLKQRLHPKYTFDVHGWLIEAEYFEELTVATDSYGFHIFSYDKPVVKYNASYVSEASGYVAHRTVTRKWYLASGTYSNDAKISFKIYEPLAARTEGRIRRKNLINRLLIDTVGLFIMTSNDLNNVLEAEADAIPFMRDIDGDINAYYEYGTKLDSQGNPCKLIQSVMSHTYSRLDNWVPGTGDTVSIRDFIISRLDP
jgi:hypothetical protein